MHGREKKKKDQQLYQNTLYRINKTQPPIEHSSAFSKQHCVNHHLPFKNNQPGRIQGSWFQILDRRALGETATCPPTHPINQSNETRCFRPDRRAKTNSESAESLSLLFFPGRFYPMIITKDFYIDHVFPFPL